MRQDALIDVHTHNPLSAGFSVVDCPFEESGTKLSFDRCSLSFHPKRLECSAFDPIADKFFRESFDAQVWAIGEVGLDANVAVDKTLQIELFLLWAQMAEQVGKPLIVHCVKMFQELSQVYAMVRPRQAWIVHGFRGKPEQAEQLLRLPRLYLSFGFRYHEQTIRQMPADRLLIESDEHPCIEEIYRKIAQDRGTTVEELNEGVRSVLPLLES